MPEVSIGINTAHRLPDDLRITILENEDVLEQWNSLTPLARNEFICWVENAKIINTRKRRICRTAVELLEGKRRPCCWTGCVHRTDKPPSPSQKWASSKLNDN